MSAHSFWYLLLDSKGFIYRIVNILNVWLWHVRGLLRRFFSFEASIGFLEASSDFTTVLNVGSLLIWSSLYVALGCVLSNFRTNFRFVLVRLDGFPSTTVVFCSAIWLINPLGLIRMPWIWYSWCRESLVALPFYQWRRYSVLLLPW